MSFLCRHNPAFRIKRYKAHRRYFGTGGHVSRAKTRLAVKRMLKERLVVRKPVAWNRWRVRHAYRINRRNT